MTPQFDTSGCVNAQDGQYLRGPDGQLYPGLGWGGLSPFTQGYVEALFATLNTPPDGEDLAWWAARRLGKVVRWENGWFTVRRAMQPGEGRKMRRAALLTEIAAHKPVAFSDLAPETLARIMEDCERAEPLSCFYLMEAGAAGATFWKWRKIGVMAEHGFPPLTPYLGDDGKVRLS